MSAESQQRSPGERWALVVIDMQNDFLHGDGYYARRSSDATQRTVHGLRDPAIASMVGGVAAAVTTAREYGRPIAFVRAVYDRGFSVVPPSLLRNPNRTDFPCKPGTWGANLVAPVAALVEDTAADAVETMIDKHTYNAFHETSLHEFLQGTDADSVVLCGTETQVCVLASAQHAAFLGYHPFILEDAVWSANHNAANAGLAMFRDAYGSTLTTEELSRNR